jgi:thiol:disulfide interchange protein DsbD
MRSLAPVASLARWLGVAVTASVLTLALLAPAQGQNIPQPDEAFQPSAAAAGADRVRIDWQIVDATYLYRSKIDVTVVEPDGVSVTELRIPQGKTKYDPTFDKEMQVFRDSAQAVAVLERPAKGALDVALEVSYQGCADAGVCYPPQTARFDVTLPAPGSTQAAELATGSEQAGRGGGAPTSEQTRFANALETGGLLAVGVFFLAGLGLAFTPCVFPMIPILSGIIVGQGGEHGMTKRRAFSLSLAYVLGVAVTYAILGVIAGATGAYIQAALQNPWVIGAFAAVFVALALSMFGFYDIQMPASVQTRIQQKQQETGSGGGLFGTAFMGVLSALIVGPCVAPPLAGALLYIGQQGDLVLGGVSLFALSLGMGVPLLVVGTTAGSVLPKAGGWMERVKYVFGVLMLAVAVYLLSRVVPAGLTLFLWGVLLVVSAVYMGALERLDAEASGWRRLWKGLGVVLLVLGTLELVGSVTGARDPFHPLAGLRASGGGGGAVQHAGLEFRQVKSLEGLQQAVSSAAEQGRPVMLDFYADWCVECKRYERTTFTDPGVKQALEGVTLLQVDVTEQDAADKRIQSHFNVIGPPAILFFNADGEEIAPARIAGYQGAEAFTDHIRSTLKR